MEEAAGLFSEERKCLQPGDCSIVALNNATLCRISKIYASLLRNDENIISNISVTDIIFDGYLGKWNYRVIPKVKNVKLFFNHSLTVTIACREILSMRSALNSQENPLFSFALLGLRPFSFQGGN